MVTYEHPVITQTNASVDIFRKKGCKEALISRIFCYLIYSLTSELEDRGAQNISHEAEANTANPLL